MASVVRMRRANGKIVANADVYVGRRCTMGGWALPDSKWKNPYKVNATTPLGEVLMKYTEHLFTYTYEGKVLIEHISELENKSLGCFCHNRTLQNIQEEQTFKCHADILLYLADKVGRREPL